MIALFNEKLKEWINSVNICRSRNPSVLSSSQNKLIHLINSKPVTYNNIKGIIFTSINFEFSLRNNCAFLQNNQATHLNILKYLNSGLGCLKCYRKNHKRPKQSLRSKLVHSN